MAGSAERAPAKPSLRRLILGRRLANRDSEERKIGAAEAVPAMGLDGLGSSAYGPEAALTVLMPLGAASLAYIGPVMGVIIALLAVLFVAYWQTITAYPNNGGAYVVAKQNLGANASLFAAAALMIDYVLNVAVGISAGVGALVSALPSLHPYVLPLCLAILALITLVNLRGTLDAGRVVAVPTYLFMASFLAILVIGIGKALFAGGHPQPLVAPAALPPIAGAASLWLLLRAFASGCTAMTGVEAVSNGMSAFREPRVRRGRQTLAAIVGVLAVLLAGIAYLATAYRVGAMDETRAGYRSVLAQLAGAVVGRGLFYDVAIGSVLCVLALSANTSFVAFPRLCRMVAEDGYLPHPFAIAGRRLVFSVGILYLAACSGLLLVVFGGITDRLIPLFAIGAFATFTLSQAGMVVHWRRAPATGGSAGHRGLHMPVAALGASATGAALLVMVVAKFGEGAWVTVLVILAVIALLKAIGVYYERLRSRVADGQPLTLADVTPPIILVTVEEWDRIASTALELALSLSPDVIAIHLTQLSGPEAEAEDLNMQRDWRAIVEEPARRAGRVPPRLMLLQAQYRTLHMPVLKLAKELESKFGGRRIAILIPQLVKQRWFQHLLHSHRAAELRSQLLRHGGDRLTIIELPWHAP
jgi:amino acid transporter